MKYILLLCIMSLLFACTQQERTNESSRSNFIFANHKMNPYVFDEKYGIEGFYTGFFEALKFDDTKDIMYRNKITVAIDSITATNIYGHSVVAGNYRPFKGEYEKDAHIWHVTAREPGDDKYDGVFKFMVDGNKMILQGSWKANDTNLAVSEREYVLEKKEFTYDPQQQLPEYLTYEGIYGSYNEKTDMEEGFTDDIFKFNASVDILKKEDVENMYQADLEILRNSIYARHGYSFKNRRMRFVFDNFVEWYMPVSVNITSQLTEIEKQNIDLIKRYEEHASKYYDVFGR